MNLDAKDPLIRVSRAALACRARLIRILPHPDDETLAECGQFFPDAIRELVDEIVKCVLSDPEAFRKEEAEEGGGDESAPRE